MDNLPLSWWPNPSFLSGDDMCQSETRLCQAYIGCVLNRKEPYTRTLAIDFSSRNDICNASLIVTWMRSKLPQSNSIHSSCSLEWNLGSKCIVKKKKKLPADVQCLGKGERKKTTLKDWNESYPEKRPWPCLEIQETTTVRVRRKRECQLEGDMSCVLFSSCGPRARPQSPPGSAVCFWSKFAA